MTKDQREIQRKLRILRHAEEIGHNAYRLELEGQSMRKTITKMDDETPQT